MIPNKNSHLYKQSKYSILETGDIIKENDEYYNPSKYKWLQIEREFINQE